MTVYISIHFRESARKDSWFFGCTQYSKKNRTKDKEKNKFLYAE